jgi:hypothetical protein
MRAAAGKKTRGPGTIRPPAALYVTEIREENRTGLRLIDAVRIRRLR